MNKDPYFNNKLLELFKDFLSSQGKMYFGGLIAISLLIVQAFLPLTQYDLPAFISMLAFAIAIPLLAGAFYSVSSVGKRGVVEPLIPFLFLQQLGTVAAIVGVTAAFWHVSWMLGVLFVISTLVSAIVYSYVIGKTSGRMEEIVQAIEEHLQ